MKREQEYDEFRDHLESQFEVANQMEIASNGGQQTEIEFPSAPDQCLSVVKSIRETIDARA